MKAVTQGTGGLPGYTDGLPVSDWFLLPVRGHPEREAKRMNGFAFKSWGVPSQQSRMGLGCLEKGGGEAGLGSLQQAPKCSASLCKRHANCSHLGKLIAI